MATFDSTNIEITYVSPQAGSVYSYAGMPLSDSLPEASQIQVRFNTSLVYADATEGGGGSSVAVADLDPAIQEAIIVLPASLYTVDTDQQTITIAPLGDTLIDIPGVSTDYYRPQGADTSASTPIVLRRSTDINAAVVTFAPGARLTAGMLNASTTQLLHASQELTAFSGGSGSSGGGQAETPDLSGNVLWDIGNVETPAGNGILEYDGTNITIGAGGSLVPVDGDAGFVLAKATNASGDTEWYDIQTNLAAPLFSQISNLGTRVTGVESKTQKQSYSNPGGVPTTEFAGDISVAADPTSGNGGDIIVSGNSVNDAINYTQQGPYWINMNLGDTLVDITGTGARIAGKSSDFVGNPLYTGSGVVDLNTTTGEWTAPRDMVINIKIAGHIKTDDGPPVSGSQLIRGLLNCTVNGVGQLTQTLLYRRITPEYSQPLVFGELEGILEVQAGDVVILQLTRAGSSTASVGLENGSAIIKEVR